MPRQGCLDDQSFPFDGSTSRQRGCLKDTSAKCTLISNEVTVHEYLKICNTVPQLHPSAAVAAYTVTRVRTAKSPLSPKSGGANLLRA